VQKFWYLNTEVAIIHFLLEMCPYNSYSLLHVFMVVNLILLAKLRTTPCTVYNICCISRTLSVSKPRVFSSPVIAAPFSFLQPTILRCVFLQKWTRWV